MFDVQADPVLEVAIIERLARAAAVKKIASLQLGEAFIGLDLSSATETQNNEAI